LFGFTSQSILPRNAVLLILWSMGVPSSWPRVAWKKLRRARRWHSALALMRPSLDPIVGLETGQEPRGSERFGRCRFSRIPSRAAKKNA
jgi:hypothetical protein